jgi:hypothetical protein
MTSQRQGAAADRVAAADDRLLASRDRSAAARERDIQDESSAVAAHSLLNSSAVVAMGIETLEANWEGITPIDRATLLQRIQLQSASIQARLRELIHGSN